MIVVIKSNSRFVRFHASSEICTEFKNKIYSVVNITFIRKSDEKLQLVTMKITPRNNRD